MRAGAEARTAQLDPGSLDDIAGVFTAKLAEFPLKDAAKPRRDSPLMWTGTLAFLDVIGADEIVLADASQQFRRFVPSAS